MQRNPVKRTYNRVVLKGNERYDAHCAVCGKLICLDCYADGYRYVRQKKAKNGSIHKIYYCCWSHYNAVTGSEKHGK